jgi:hypothetical protein
MDCGKQFLPCQMDFDHRPGENKLQVVARLTSREAILSEIKKCDLVCANCHRLRTWTREQTFGNKNRKTEGGTEDQFLFEWPTIAIKRGVGGGK